ncbi:MAG: hypothetical protein COX79_05180 [Candidatus Levybacteria bacterium CG_4_10_14_0_2_um_filter_36_16]|nr:MAG: hypothetical protein AUK12_00970 [Candidatus Levybacteria bacterium CG2_30_37_29]PIR79348.1 MAG: hypothetical protein COU26_01565 [Candidatus Levybacteria bacterium CG10_big_fil_rev_8_21_14_0_10_36_30]PIZ96449.1 MAG: hypothetical protein COX79_05180 [Candidatus Levybacteria bacterium CG_4_10_14_0_2_um_filter_36_16]PJA90375.1 MAG: hypothetical protein CO136_02285 [Candidatus Levybacteria bacterium CG_4_9_14_3_um_filter_36_7]
MKKRIFSIFAFLLILTGLFIAVYIASQVLIPPGKGALQVTSNIKAKVFLDDKNIGTTNFCKCSQNETIDSREYTIRIVPEDKTQIPFTRKIRITPNVLTAIERTFLVGSYASSSILTLEKTSEKDASLFVASIPDGALVTLDGNQVGATPYFQKNISASEHELEIRKQGFGKKTLRIRAVSGYKLVVNSVLGTEATDQDETSVSPTPLPSTLTPTPASSTQVKISQTPTGFLRVRKEPSVAGSEIGRVSPGETYSLLDEKNGWYQIKLRDETSGWISSTYAQKISIQ